MSENDYIAEYVKERCPELLDTVDFNTWKLGRAIGELANAFLDHLSKIGGKLNTAESEKKAYRKIESIPFLMHKELNVPISECQKAYDVAIEYLRSQSKMKG